MSAPYKKILEQQFAALPPGGGGGGGGAGGGGGSGGGGVSEVAPWGRWQFQFSATRGDKNPPASKEVAARVLC